MELNHNCIRDVLLEVEKLQLGGSIHARVLATQLPQYEFEVVIYSIRKLFEAKYISGNEPTGNHSGGVIKDITWKGHSFLDNIKPKETWDIVSVKAKSIGSVSIDIISSIAAQVGASLLSRTLGL